MYAFQETDGQTDGQTVGHCHRVMLRLHFVWRELKNPSCNNDYYHYYYYYYTNYPAVLYGPPKLTLAASCCRSRKQLAAIRVSFGGPYNTAG